MKRPTRWIYAVLILAQTFFLMTGCGHAPAPDAGAADPEVLQIRVLKVGKADAIVCMCGEKTMVIDCGEEEDGQEVLDYLEGRGISRVDVLLITHYDKDHIGGADTVVEGIPVSRVLLPDYTGTGTEYGDFMEALEKAGIRPERIREDQVLSLGGADVLVEPPASYALPDGNAEYDNNFSLVTTFRYGDRRLVFAGDMEKKRIREWLESRERETCDVLKVPHHGVYNTALEDLFKTLRPAYALICDSQKNPADDRTLELLKKYGAACLQTRNGDIDILCSEKGIEIRQK